MSLFIIWGILSLIWATYETITNIILGNALMWFWKKKRNSKRLESIGMKYYNILGFLFWNSLFFVLLYSMKVFRISNIKIIAIQWIAIKVIIVAFGLFLWLFSGKKAKTEQVQIIKIAAILIAASFIVVLFRIFGKMIIPDYCLTRQNCCEEFFNAETHQGCFFYYSVVVAKILHMPVALVSRFFMSSYIISLCICSYELLLALSEKVFNIRLKRVYVYFALFLLYVVQLLDESYIGYNLLTNTWNGIAIYVGLVLPILVGIILYIESSVRENKKNVSSKIVLLLLMVLGFVYSLTPEFMRYCLVLIVVVFIEEIVSIKVEKNVVEKDKVFKRSIGILILSEMVSLIFGIIFQMVESEKINVMTEIRLWLIPVMVIGLCYYLYHYRERKIEILLMFCILSFSTIYLGMNTSRLVINKNLYGISNDIITIQENYLSTSDKVMCNKEFYQQVGMYSQCNNYEINETPKNLEEEMYLGNDGGYSKIIVSKEMYVDKVITTWGIDEEGNWIEQQETVPINQLLDGYLYTEVYNGDDYVLLDKVY